MIAAFLLLLLPISVFSCFCPSCGCSCCSGYSNYYGYNNYGYGSQAQQSPYAPYTVWYQRPIPVQTVPVEPPRSPLPPPPSSHYPVLVPPPAKAADSYDLPIVPRTNAGYQPPRAVESLPGYITYNKGVAHPPAPPVFTREEVTTVRPYTGTTRVVPAKKGAKGDFEYYYVYYDDDDTSSKKQSGDIKKRIHEGEMPRRQETIGTKKNTIDEYDFDENWSTIATTTLAPVQITTYLPPIPVTETVPTPPPEVETITWARETSTWAPEPPVTSTWAPEPETTTWTPLHVTTEWTPETTTTIWTPPSTTTTWAPPPTTTTWAPPPPVTTTIARTTTTTTARTTPPQARNPVVIELGEGDAADYEDIEAPFGTTTIKNVTFKPATITFEPQTDATTTTTVAPTTQQRGVAPAVTESKPEYEYEEYEVEELQIVNENGKTETITRIITTTKAPKRLH